MKCYYDGMTLAQAVNFIERYYNSTPSEKQIEKVKSEIKSCLNKEWE